MLDFDLCIMDPWEISIFAGGFVLVGIVAGLLLAIPATALINRYGFAPISLTNFALGFLAPPLLAALIVRLLMPLVSPGGICGHAFTPDTVVLLLLIPLLPLAAAVTFGLRVIGSKGP